MPQIAPICTDARRLPAIPSPRELSGGSQVLAAGQLSDRWMIDGGHTSRCGVIVASIVKTGPAEASAGILL